MTCLTKEEVVLIIFGLAVLGFILGNIWDSMFQHPKDN